MILRFCSGSVTSRERGEELLGRVDDLEPDAGGGHVVALHLLALALAQQAVVDEHARELVADRAVHQRRRDGGVDATREPTQHVTIADAGADLGHRVVDDVLRGPRRLDAGTVVEEALQHRLPVRGVHHLGVPLEPEQVAVGALEGRDLGTGRARRSPRSRVARPRPRRGATSTPAASPAVRRRAPRAAPRWRWCARTRRPRCASPCRRAPRPWPGTRSRSRASARRRRTARGRRRAHRRRRRWPGHRRGSPPPGAWRASRPRASRGGRSRCRRSPRARGGR